MVVYFPAPGSYTGEDMFELHCHGGVAVLQAVHNALLALGAKPAAPGEFTKRAFLNGKLDLSQAEAVMDLIGAQARLSARAALRQMQGKLSEAVRAVEAHVIGTLGAINAAIDYPDEVGEEVYADLSCRLSCAAGMLSALIEQGYRARVLRDGFRVVLLGAPNAGKSSLLNALLGRRRAIVTASPGTTRDTLDELIPISGMPVMFTDTAGIRQTDDEAEREGVTRAWAAAQNADLVFVLLDGAAKPDENGRALLRDTAGMRRVVLCTKADMPAAWLVADMPALAGEKVVCVSAITGEGLDALLKTILEYAAPVEDALITNQRHISALENALGAIENARAHGQTDPDCVGTDLRDALSALGAITGNDVDESVIDHIFERFCVGK
jgi:tRNA modification GTPase